MSTIDLIGGIFLIIFAVFLILVILLQESSNARLSGTISGGADSFFGKNKGRTFDARLHRLTRLVAILFIVVTVAVQLLNIYL